MKALELKLATMLAKDLSIDLPCALADRLFGCGCSDFVPCTVGLKAVAAHLRYQCLCLDGSWDEAEYQNCRAIMLRRNWIEVSDIVNDRDAREWIDRVVGPLVEKLVA